MIHIMLAVKYRTGECPQTREQGRPRTLPLLVIQYYIHRNRKNVNSHENSTDPDRTYDTWQGRPQKLPLLLFQYTDRRRTERTRIVTSTLRESTSYTWSGYSPFVYPITWYPLFTFRTWSGRSWVHFSPNGLFIYLWKHLLSFSTTM